MLELARPCDRAEINRLARQVHEMHVAWRPDLYRMPDELFDDGRFAEMTARRELYAAKLNGIVVGYVIIRIREYNTPEVVYRRVCLVDQICVDERLRGHGIGTRMMEEIRVLARAFGCTDLQLGVYPQNDAAVSFYQKCGFMIRSIDMQRKV